MVAFEDVLRSAARLQELVPDAVLVGGSVAAYYAGHRLSTDHDHVLADLKYRFDLVLDALETDPEWVLNRVTPGKIILGELGGIEAGVRQLIRERPLETQVVDVDGRPLTVPTAEEALRIKAYLVVKRNRLRDYLDVAALADGFGVGWAAETLSGIDDYYSSGRPGDAVASQLVRQLADPRPADGADTSTLAKYKGLALKWHDWNRNVEECAKVSAAMLAQ